MSAKVHCEAECKFTVDCVTVGIDHVITIVKIESMIHHIADICMKSKMEWENSDHLCFSFKEDYDQHLWSNISSAVLGGDSVVFKECEIAGESRHGRIGEEGGIDLTSAIGIIIEADNTSIPVNDTIGVSTKTRKTLATKPVSKFK